MKKSNILILFVSFQLTFQLAFGQRVRKYSNEFLNIGVDASAFGMSKSVTATSGDVNSIYWNPAGLSRITKNQAALMHTSYFAGIANYDYAAVAFAPKNKGEVAIAFSLIRFGVDDILNTTSLIDSRGNIDYTRISLFSAVDYAINFGIAKKIKNIKNLSVGINAKVVRRIIGDFATSWGFGLDAGVQYTIGKWQLGLMLRDITTTFNVWKIDTEGFESIKNAIPNQNKELPETTEITIPKLHFGVARGFRFKNKDFYFLSEFDLNVRFVKTNDLFSSSFISMDPSIGFQLDYKDFVFLRAGVGNFQHQNEFDGGGITLQPNIGLGFKYHGVQIDYALSNIASVGNALYSNTFSIKIDFDFLRNSKSRL